MSCISTYLIFNLPLNQFCSQMKNFNLYIAVNTLVEKAVAWVDLLILQMIFKGCG